MTTDTDRGLEVRRRLWHDTSVRGTQKLVALAIAQFPVDEHGWTTVSCTELAEMATCSRSALRRATRELRQRHLLDVEIAHAGRGHRNRYRLNL